MSVVKGMNVTGMAPGSKSERMEEKTGLVELYNSLDHEGKYHVYITHPSPNTSPFLQAYDGPSKAAIPPHHNCKRYM